MFVGSGTVMKSHTLLMALTFSWTTTVEPALAQPPAPQQLTEPSAVRALLSDKLVGYSLPGWADTEIWEGFQANGVWTGTHLGRGPVNFSGRWSIKGGRVCVIPDEGTHITKWFSGSRCRAIWREANTGRLSMEYLNPQDASFGPLTLEVRDFPVDVSVRNRVDSCHSSVGP